MTGLAGYAGLKKTQCVTKIFLYSLVKDFHRILAISPYIRLLSFLSVTGNTHSLHM